MIAPVMLIRIAIAAWSGAWRAPSQIAVLLIALFLAGVVTIAWRNRLIGMRVSRCAVRMRWMLRTRTYPWTEITRFHRAGDVILPEEARRLWLERRDRLLVRTPVRRKGVYPRRWLRYRGGDDGITLEKVEFDDLVRRLNLIRSLALSRSTPSGPSTCAQTPVSSWTIRTTSA